MRLVYLHLGLSLFLALTVIPNGECGALGTAIESMWIRLERIFESSLLRGPLEFLRGLRTVKLLKTSVRFLVATFAELPYKESLKALDFVCETVQKEGLVGRPGLIKADELAVILIDDEGKESIPLPRLATIADNPKFMPNRDLVIFIPGWTQENEEFDSVTEQLVAAFNERLDRMFGVMKLGTTLNNLYSWSAYNAREVGNYLGLYLSKLIDQVPAERIHLIGAGLGAQIAGFAGKRFELKTSKKLRRITGLDPSRPCFGSNGLDKASAYFVDVIHSSKLFGAFETNGHADFYANRISAVLSAEGCKTFFCRHQQAVLYFAESVIPGQERSFCGLSCESRNRFELGSCQGREEVTMGLLAPSEARGSYYLNTNIQSPYGKCSQQNRTEGSETEDNSPPDTGENSAAGSESKDEESPKTPTNEIEPIVEAAPPVEAAEQPETSPGEEASTNEEATGDEEEAPSE